MHHGHVRFIPSQRRANERLLWSRDIRFVNQLAERLSGGRLLDLEGGVCLIAPASQLTDGAASDVARVNRNPEYGLVSVDPSIPESDRYLVALGAAVQQSGLAERIGMGQSIQVAQTKTLDHFFTLRGLHQVAFQPIVELATGELHEHECLFRPVMPTLPQSISAIVQAAIDTGRSVELDLFIVRIILDRAAALQRASKATHGHPLRLSINLTPSGLLDPRFEAHAFADMIHSAGLHPRQITVEVTEQQAVSDLGPLKRQARALRKLGFGFAVDDAGAGYASFTLVAALRPSIIKIDREIVRGIRRDDAKQALVEAFVSFGRRIEAQLIAEGIERRHDLETLIELGVEFGQGFLLGRPALEPEPPRRLPRRVVATLTAVGGRPAADDRASGMAASIRK
jgi:EAL domain-containing protein (putative c-di-GMP-specific phosphodiesterase class I)